MALPFFQAAGTKSAGSGSVTVSWPAHLADDIALLFVETAGQTASLSSPQGFAQVDSQLLVGTAGQDGSVGLSVWWKRAVGGDANPTVGDSGDHQICQMAVFRGCVSSGNPWEVIAGDTVTSPSTSVAVPGALTTVPDQLIVCCVAQGTDTSSNQVSGWFNQNLGNVAEITEFASTQGRGGGFAVATGENNTPDNYGSTTATLATASLQARISISLKPLQVVISSTGNSSGVADGNIVGNAIWDTLVASAGVADGTTAAVALTTGSGLSSGQGDGGGLGSAIWRIAGSSSGVGIASGDIGAVTYGTGSSAGSAAIGGFAARVIPGVSASVGSSTVQSNSNTIGAFTAQSSGVADGHVNSLVTAGATASAQGSAVAIMFTPRFKTLYLSGTGATVISAYQQLNAAVDGFLLNHEEREIVFAPAQPSLDEFGVSDDVRYEAHLFVYFKE